MSVTRETVAKIASLARIRMGEAELDRMVPELNNILAWVEQLGEVDVSGVEPMTAVIPQQLRLRDDVVDADPLTGGGVRDKVEEELREVMQAPAERQSEEIGDLLFAVANWSRHLAVDPEEALRLANAKFERRFRAMEQLARERSLALKSLDAAAWDAMWNEVKAS